ncbi:hypothetical protein [uncultured Tateyamaria sp.]|uniref:hypothetical protein n=1 Tax=uncultured Tateyamaria sp. TaxID=455651 RepID=UPI0026125027|nr:hypothetical protein [uncultured Tateyamaria sp.]
MTLDTIYEDLSAAIAADRFPASVVPQAQGLCETLTSPARITLFGMPGAGKTGVLNLLAGGRAVPDHMALGTVRVAYGEQEKTEVTLASGETLAMDGLPDPDALSGMQPALTQVFLPMPALTQINLMEVSFGTDPTGQARAIKWAAKQTDMAIWCTTGFTQAEDALWQTTPDRMRDHGFLLLTQTDRLDAERNERLAQLHQAAGSEFAYVLGVSVHEANAAAAQGSIDKEMMRASGGMKLISTILKEIENGRQNMIDQAQVLLRMHPEVTQFPTSGAATADPVETPAPAPEPEVQPEPVVEATPDTVVVAFKAAVARLSKLGAELSETEEPDTDTVLDASISALGWLGAHLEDSDLPDTPAVSQAVAMTQDAEDLVQLMRIEGTQTARTDAILALLQLKRGFQTTLAA